MQTGGKGDDDNVSQTSVSSTSSNLSRKILSGDWEQGKHVVKAKNRVMVLQSSEFYELETVAGELLKVLNKRDESSEKLVNIINKSDRKDFQKGCLELYDDIKSLNLLVSFDNNLEETILEKLPGRIEEAKYERSLSPEKISNIFKGLKEVPTLGKKGAYLKAEFGKLDVAGKSLAVAAVATVGTLASPFVLGAGLFATPFVGTGIAAKKGIEALDKRVLEGRQELADKKKNVGFGYTFTPTVRELAEELIGFAVLGEQVKILRVAIKQSPELRAVISEANLNIIEEFITARTGKLEKLGMYNQVLNKLGEGAAEKILKLMENIKNPGELSDEESAYFHSLKKVVTKGFSASIKSAFSNKIITTGSEANRTLLKNIKKDNLADARDMLKSYSKLDEKHKTQLDEVLQKKFEERDVKNRGGLINILSKRDPTLQDMEQKQREEAVPLLQESSSSQKNQQIGGELGMLANAFNSLNPGDMKELAEKSAGLLNQQKREEKGILDKVKGVLDGVLDKVKSVSDKVKSLFTRGVSSEKAAGENKVTEL